MYKCIDKKKKRKEKKKSDVYCIAEGEEVSKSEECEEEFKVKKQVKWAKSLNVYENPEDSLGNKDLSEDLEIKEVNKSKFARNFTEKELKLIEKGDFKSLEEKEESELEDKLYPLSENVREKNSTVSDKNESEEEITNTVADVTWTEQDWLKWFEKELNKGDEQVKAKAVRSEKTKTAQDFKKDSKVYSDSKVCFDESFEGSFVNESFDQLEDKLSKSSRPSNDLSFVSVDQNRNKESRVKEVAEESESLSPPEVDMKFEKVCVSTIDTVEEEKIDVEIEDFCAVEKDNEKFMKNEFSNVKVICEMEGYTTPVIVDTGAAQSMISEKLWEKIGRPKFIPIKEVIKWNSASGHDLNVFGEVKLYFKLGKKERQFKFTVIQNLCFDCIIGVDLLHCLGVIIDLKAKRIRFKNDKEEIPIIISKETVLPDILSVYAKRNYLIRPNERILIKCKLNCFLPTRVLGLIEESSESNPEIRIATSLNVLENGEVYVEIFNPNIIDILVYTNISTCNRYTSNL